MPQAAAAISSDDNLLLMSSHKRRKSLLPQDLITNTFNVVDQLQTSFKLYSGGKSTVSLKIFPAYLGITVEQLKFKVRLPPNGRHPGSDPVYSCCLSHGMILLAEHGMIQELNRLKKMAYTEATAENSGELEQLHLIIGSFQTSFISGATEELKVRVPSYLVADLVDLSRQLGMSQSNTMVLSVLVSVLSQPETESFQKEKIKSVLVPFFKMLKIRLRLLEVLISML